MPTIKTQGRFLILEDQSTILGYEIIIGLDIIKTLNIELIQRNDSMVATINGIEIGREELLPLHSIAAISNEDNLYTSTLFEDLSNKYCSIFAEAATTVINTSPMIIDLNDHEIPKARLGRYSQEDIIEMHNQVTKLMRNDIIEPSTSNYSSRAHLVPKKNGQKRMVVNFQPLNEITVKDHYPLPQLPDLFGALRDSRYFATLDCTEGFFQILIDKSHRNRTAFITPHGLYQFKRCPFGFTNSPAKFQRTMNQIFEDGLYKRCVVYIDDILVYGKTKAELFANLSWVFDKCSSNQVQLKRSKCTLLSEKVQFLGFQLSFNKIAPIPGKCDPLKALSPQNGREVLSILGTLNYYARFIPDFSEKTRELRKMTKKNVLVNWSKRESEQVLNLLRDLDKASAHIIPNSYSPKKLEVMIRNSSVEVACFDEQDQLINRAGNMLSASENNYTEVEKILLGLILAYDKFGSFLRGPVTLVTTCKALKHALELKSPPERVERLILKLPPDIDVSVKLLPRVLDLEKLNESENPPEEVFYTDGACTGNGKPHCLASWAVLATMNPNLSARGIVHHLKPSNQVAELTAVEKACEISVRNNLKDITIISDSKYCCESINKWMQMWRQNGWKDNRNRPIVNEGLLKRIAEFKDILNITCIHVKGHSDNQFNNEVDMMARSILEQSLPYCLLAIRSPAIVQSNDKEVQDIITRLEHDDKLKESFVLQNDQLYYIDQNLPAHNRLRLFVPDANRRHILRIAHDDPVFGGHFGRKKTKNKLIGYYWPGMQKQIDTYIDNCEICQHHKTPRQKKPGLLHPISCSTIFETLHIDIVGKIKESAEGNCYIITAIDAFSRYAYAKAVPETKTENVIQFINEEIIGKHGLPQKIISDNGVQFTSNAFAEFTSRLDIKHSRTADYHPSANGMDERFNGTLVKILKNFIERNQLNWDKKLPWALYLYNVTSNESTKLSPYCVMFGKHPRLPLVMPKSLETPEKLDETVTKEEIEEFVRSNITIAQDQQKKYYDSKRVSQNFKLYDLVMAKSHAPPRGDSRKLAYKWEGPYIISKMIKFGDEAPVSAHLLDLDTLKVKRVAFQDIKHFRDHNDESDQELELPGTIITKMAEDNDRNSTRIKATEVSLPNHNPNQPTISTNNLETIDKFRCYPYVQLNSSYNRSVSTHNELPLLSDTSTITALEQEDEIITGPHGSTPTRRLPQQSSQVSHENSMIDASPLKQLSCPSDLSCNQKEENEETTIRQLPQPSGPHPDKDVSGSHGAAPLSQTINIELDKQGPENKGSATLKEPSDETIADCANHSTTADVRSLADIISDPNTPIRPSRIRRRPERFSPLQ